MIEELDIRTELEHLATLVSFNGRALATAVHPDYREATDRWLGHGLVEWDRSGEFAVQVTTLPSSPEFLARLEAYLRRQFPGTTLTRRVRTPIARRTALTSGASITNAVAHVAVAATLTLTLAVVGQAELGRFTAQPRSEANTAS